VENLVKFIVRFHFIILFIVLEVFSLSLAINNDEAKRSVIVSSANAVSGFFYKYFNVFSNYINLKTENQGLHAQNRQLQTDIDSLKSVLNSLPYWKNSKNPYYFPKEIILSDSASFTKSEQHNDSIEVTEFKALPIYIDTVQRYYYMSAKVIKNSVNTKYNFLTLDKGKNDGIAPDMAVISTKGVVGIVSKVSNNFASVISILNVNLGISAKIRNNDYFGSIVWDGNDYTTVSLKEIPNQVQVHIGDTIVTSGYSATFPEGIPVGTICDFKPAKGSNFLNISVRLMTDFKNVTYIFIISDTLRNEFMNL